MTLPRPVVVTGLLVGGALVAWIVTYQRMHGMDAGPGTDPGGFEYTGENEEAETAVATKLVAKGDVEFADANSHSSMAYVRHGNAFQEKYTPTVVEAG